MTNQYIKRFSFKIFINIRNKLFFKELHKIVCPSTGNCSLTRIRKKIMIPVYIENSDYNSFRHFVIYRQESGSRDSMLITSVSIENIKYREFCIFGIVSFRQIDTYLTVLLKDI